MAQSWAAEFYRSPAWRAARRAYIKERRGLCERCLAKGIYTPGKVVHHREHLTPQNIRDERVALGKDNLELLCQDCHAKEHAAQSRYKIDEDGNLIEWD